MEIKQVYEFVNNAASETIGDSILLSEDLSNVVDVGEAIFNANAFDAFVRTLVNHIGRVVFVNRPYRGSAPSVLMTAWEYGSVVQKKYIDVKFVLDERIVDGFYYATFFKHYRRILRNPEILDNPPEEVVRDID